MRLLSVEHAVGVRIRPILDAHRMFGTERGGVRRG